MMMDNVFGGHAGTRVYPTKSDPEPAPEIVALIKQRAEEKRLRKMKNL